MNKVPRRKPAPLTMAQKSEYAERALFNPPAAEFIERAEPRGNLVWRCVIPAKLCLTTNAKANMHWASLHRAKQSIIKAMLIQHGCRARATVLAGRPQVLITRFTTNRPDRGAGWEKMPIDALLTSRTVVTKRGPQTRSGLGFIVDDSDMHVDVRAWWEPGPKDGFVLLRIFSGGET